MIKKFTVNQKKELILGAALFILFCPLETINFEGKEYVTKVNKKLKSKLDTYKKQNKKEYLKLVYKASDLMEEVLNDLRDDGLVIKDTKELNLVEDEKLKSNTVRPHIIIGMLKMHKEDVFNALEIPISFSQRLGSLATPNWDASVNNMHFIMGLIEKVDNEFK